jgi:hypothetical protein
MTTPAAAVFWRNSLRLKFLFFLFIGSASRKLCFGPTKKLSYLQAV